MLRNYSSRSDNSTQYGFNFISVLIVSAIVAALYLKA